MDDPDLIDELREARGTIRRITTMKDWDSLPESRMNDYTKELEACRDLINRRLGI